MILTNSLRLISLSPPICHLHVAGVCHWLCAMATTARRHSARLIPRTVADRTMCDADCDLISQEESGTDWDDSPSMQCHRKANLCTLSSVSESLSQEKMSNEQSFLVRKRKSQLSQLEVARRQPSVSSLLCPWTSCSRRVVVLYCLLLIFLRSGFSVCSDLQPSGTC